MCLSNDSCNSIAKQAADAKTLLFCSSRYCRRLRSYHMRPLP